VRLVSEIIVPNFAGPRQADLYPRMQLLAKLKPFGWKVVLEHILAQPHMNTWLILDAYPGWDTVGEINSLPATTAKRDQWRSDIVNLFLKLCRSGFNTADLNYDDGAFCGARYAALNLAALMGQDARPLAEEVLAIYNEPNFSRGRAKFCGQDAALKALVAMGFDLIVPLYG
jgi:hypothetical protein